MEDKMVSAAELSVLGIFGSAVAALFGGWNEAMTTLCIFMAIDYLTGLFVAIAGRAKNQKRRTQFQGWFLWIDEESYDHAYYHSSIQT